MKFLGLLLFYISWPAQMLLIRGTTRPRLIVRVGSEVLMVKTWVSLQKWSFPGGGIKNCEPPKQAATREIKEELGLIVEPKKLSLIDESIKSEAGIKYNCPIYIIDLDNKPNIKKSIEIRQFAWIDVKNIPEHINQKVLIYLSKK